MARDFETQSPDEIVGTVQQPVRQTVLVSSSDKSDAALATRPAWNDGEIRRFTLRAALFQRRGCDAGKAETLADMTVFRDRDHDDRRMCIECEHLQRDGGCFAARQGWITGAAKNLQPVLTVLQRCEHFGWQKP